MINKLSQQAILEYQSIYKKIYQKEIDFIEAQKQALRLLEVVRNVCKLIENQNEKK